MTKDAEVWAFPTPQLQTPPESCGMTLRDWFAGQVLVGAGDWDADPNVLAAGAYSLADAMMAVRQSKPKDAP